MYSGPTKNPGTSWSEQMFVPVLYLPVTHQAASISPQVQVELVPQLPGPDPGLQPQGQVLCSLL